jgi:hypothetical protein
MMLAGCTAQTNEATLFGQLLGPPAADGLAPGQPPLVSPAAQGPGKRDCAGPAECKMVLKTLIENPDRGWIGKPSPPDAYANGTRLFAYRALRKQLTCGELRLAVNELHAVSKTLGGPVAGMAPDQAARTRALCSQVQVELTKERAGRCRR